MRAQYAHTRVRPDQINSVLQRLEGESGRRLGARDRLLYGSALRQGQLHELLETQGPNPLAGEGALAVSTTWPGGVGVGVAARALGAAREIVKRWPAKGPRGPGAPFPTRPVSPDKIHGLDDTVARAQQGAGKYKKDGTRFRDDEGRLPEGNYTEWTVPTPGDPTRGARRLVIDRDSGRAFYTWDHYKNFVPVRLP